MNLKQLFGRANSRLRPELRYQPPEPRRMAQLSHLLTDIEGQLEQGGNAAAAITRFNALTGRDYVAWDFQTYYSYTSTEGFLASAAVPAPKRVPDLARAELLAILRSIRASKSEAEQAYYMELFDAQVTLPSASLLLFHPPKGASVDPGKWNPSEEEVVDLALAHKPIAL
jgi:hypothetical protein